MLEMKTYKTKNSTMKQQNDNKEAAAITNYISTFGKMTCTPPCNAQPICKKK